jgi:hypothetical protein
MTGTRILLSSVIAINLQLWALDRVDCRAEPPRMNCNHYLLALGTELMTAMPVSAFWLWLAIRDQ